MIILATASEAIREVLTELDRAASASEIIRVINQRYPNKWKESTIYAHLYGCSVNNPPAYTQHPSAPKFLFDLGGRRYELYNPEKHGKRPEIKPIKSEQKKYEPKEKTPILVIDDMKYMLRKPKNEPQLQGMVKEHSKQIFGKDSLYFDVKGKMSSKAGVGSKPDGYAISFCGSPQWFVVEIELSNRAHDLYRHILPQIMKFMNGIENRDTQEEISEWLYNVIHQNLSTKSFVEKNIKEEISHFLTKLIGQPPVVVIIIDEKTPKLEEACKKLNTQIVEFKTFWKSSEKPSQFEKWFNESEVSSEHAHLVSEPIEEDTYSK